MGELIHEERLLQLRQRRRNMESVAVRPLQLDDIFPPGPDAFYFKPDLKPPAASILPDLTFLIKEEDEIHL